MNIGIEKVKSYLKEVCLIPRSSGDEKRIADYITAFAKERGLDVWQDETGNLIIRKPGTIEGAEPVILQGHLDMVYVKEEGCPHQYEDGITVREDEEYYFADGTSLGGDNGIAIAYCLAILDSRELKHPDLEVIFTVREETGLVGASMLDLSSLKGTRFINLDSEEEGIFYTSCAGGLRCRMLWKHSLEQVEEQRLPLKVQIRDLSGGHSGINIGKGLGNAIVLMGRLCYGLRKLDLRMGEILAPGKANAIANSGYITFYVKPEDEACVKTRIQELEQVFRVELQDTDQVTCAVECGEVLESFQAYPKQMQEDLIRSLVLLPDGVYAYSHAMEGFIETSMNLGSLTVEDGSLVLLMSIRSSVESRKYLLRDKIQIIAEEYCDDYIFESDYPGWQYRKESPLREKAAVVFERLFEKKPELSAIHAGLECGYWESKKPGLDIISAGPNQYDVHSTKEKLSKKSVEHMWLWLTTLLEELAE